jgi:hypothetical protein
MAFLNDSIYNYLKHLSYIFHSHFFALKHRTLPEILHVFIAKQHGKYLKHALYFFAPGYHTDKQALAILEKL